MSEGLGLPPRPPGPLPRYGSFGTPGQLNGGAASPPPPLPLAPPGVRRVALLPARAPDGSQEAVQCTLISLMHPRVQPNSVRRPHPSVWWGHPSPTWPPFEHLQQGQPVALAYQDVHKRPAQLKGSAWKVRGGGGLRIHRLRGLTRTACRLTPPACLHRVAIRVHLHPHIHCSILPWNSAGHSGAAQAADWLAWRQLVVAGACPSRLLLHDPLLPAGLAGAGRLHPDRPGASAGAPGQRRGRQLPV